jgi:hypothetical protein
MIISAKSPDPAICRQTPEWVMGEMPAFGTQEHVIGPFFCALRPGSGAKSGSTAAATQETTEPIEISL